MASMIQRRWMSLVRSISSSQIPPKVFELKKLPLRGGQNLSQRYRRLERSLRGKEARIHEVDTLERGTHSVETISRQPGVPAVQTFRGLTVPRKPDPPADDECCMSGCAICVYDLYEESLSAYEDSVTELRNSLQTMGVPTSEWPASIAPVNGATSASPPRQSQVLNAFEEFERALQAKKQATQQPTLQAAPTPALS